MAWSYKMRLWSSLVDLNNWSVILIQNKRATNFFIPFSFFPAISNRSHKLLSQLNHFPPRGCSYHFINTLSNFLFYYCFYLRCEKKPKREIPRCKWHVYSCHLGPDILLLISSCHSRIGTWNLKLRASHRSDDPLPFFLGWKAKGGKALAARSLIFPTLSPTAISHGSHDILGSEPFDFVTRLTFRFLV